MGKPVDFVEDTPEAKQQQYAEDKARAKVFDEMTSEIVKGLEAIKQVDKFYAESDYKERFKNIKYVERDDDPEIRQLYEQD